MDDDEIVLYNLAMAHLVGQLSKTDLGGIAFDPMPGPENFEYAERARYAFSDWQPAAVRALRERLLLHDKAYVTTREVVAWIDELQSMHEGNRR